MKPLRLLVIALPLVVACSKEPLGPPARITALPRALTAREQQLIQADNRFAIKLLKEANTQTRDTLPNLFVSPLSAAMALAMTYNGAAGTTATAMDTTLELAGMSVAPLYVIDRKSTRLNSSHQIISYAVFCLKKKK